MNLKMLKKDLKRKKSMNLILLIFIFLATMLIAGSWQNLTVVQNGIEYFIEKSGIADFIIIAIEGEQGSILEENDKSTRKFIENHESVSKFEEDEVFSASKKDFEIEGKEKFETRGVVLLGKCGTKAQKFFDENNNEIKEMENGTIYLTRGTLIENDLDVGDIITLHTPNGYRKEFKIVGYDKDVLFGSDMMSDIRFLISDEDFDDIMEHAGLEKLRIYSVFTGDVQKFADDYANEDLKSRITLDQERVKTIYIMAMVMAAITLMMSLCLVAISVIMLRFTIVFTVNEDYKEIGIMKAIGLKDKAIRRLYMSKYVAIAICGGVLGFIASIPFGNMLLKNVRLYMVVEEAKHTAFMQFLISAGIVFLVSFFAYLSTGKIKKATPMEAIRSGNNGERFKKKSVFSLSKSKIRPTTFLAGNDVLSELKKYIILLLTSAIGIWLVVMPVNTVNTLGSENIIDWFSLSRCDIFISDDKKTEELVMSGDKKEYYSYLEEVEKKLEDEGIECADVVLDIFLQLKARKGDKVISAFSMQGLNIEETQYCYEEGTAPEYENEVAITYYTAKRLNAKLGDTIFITVGDEEKPFIITAYFQSMNNMGDGIRFTEEAELDYSNVMGCMGAQVTLADEVTKEERDVIIEEIKEFMPDIFVQDTVGFLHRMLGGFLDDIAAMKGGILAIVILINVLVVVLMQKMFLIRERGEMAMLKAVGFSNRSIIAWQTKRIAIVLFLGIVLGSLTGTPFSQVTSGQVFKIMGADKITFQINPLEIYVLYPVIIFVMTVIACIITMLGVKKVSVQEVNNIE